MTLTIRIIISAVIYLMASFSAQAVEGLWFHESNMKKSGSYRVGRILDFSQMTFQLGGDLSGGPGDRFKIQVKDEGGKRYLFFKHNLAEHGIKTETDHVKAEIIVKSKDWIQVGGRNFYRAIQATNENAEQILTGRWGSAEGSCKEGEFSFNFKTSKVTIVNIYEGKVSKSKANFKCTKEFCTETGDGITQKNRFFYVPKLEALVVEIHERISKGKKEWVEELSHWAGLCKKD